jgi:hypothetical protein
VRHSCGTPACVAFCAAQRKLELSLPWVASLSKIFKITSLDSMALFTAFVDVLLQPPLSTALF